MTANQKYLTRRCLLLVAVALAPATAWAQFELFSGDKGALGGLGDPLGDPVTVSAQFTPATADRPAVLMITADIQPDWHVYSLTQPAGGPQRTTIDLDANPDFELISGFAGFPEYESRIDQEAWPGLEIQEHADEVTWYAPIKLAEGADPQTLEISGMVRLQACKQSCIPLKLSFTAGVGPGVPIGALDFTKPQPPATPLQPAPPSPSPVDAAGEMSAAPAGYDLEKIEFAEASGEGMLLKSLALAFVGGLVLNLMPCVLPVIGLKVMSFIDQAGKSRAHAFALNLWYSLGIVSVFIVLAALAVVAGLSWGEQFGNVAFDITMASIVFVMALSLLGVWEIPIPGFLGAGKAQEAAAQEGAIGAFLKGVITTLLATPCIGPGIGGALGWALKQPAGVTFAVFTTIGVGMASPYLLIGAKPELVRFLPKPGAWMETFKQLMGFVLIGTVIFLLGIIPTTYLLPTLVLLACLALACWVYAKTPLTASSNEKSQTWALCSAITVGGAVLAFGYLHPLLNPQQEDAWRPFSLASLKEFAVDKRQTVLVDFSADWCANCKVLEKTVLHTESVEEAIRRHDVVTMYADNTAYPPEIEETLHALRASGVPVIAVFPGGDPYRPIVFRDGYTRGGLIQALERAASARESSSLASLPSGGR